MSSNIINLTTRSRILTQSNNGGCGDSINNVNISMDLQYRIKKKFSYFCKEKYKWVTIYGITECIPRRDFIKLRPKMEKKLLRVKSKWYMFRILV
jgi:hypothetical protein